MDALLWLPRGSRPQTGPVLRGNILNVLSCIACNWPLMSPCPMCVQNPIPEVLDFSRLCPIMISDDGVNFHRHCLKWNIFMSAVRTPDGVTIGYVPGGISVPIPYPTVAPPVNPIVLQGSLPQGLLQQRPVQEGIVQPGLVQQEVGHHEPVQQGLAPNGHFHQGLFDQDQGFVQQRPAYQGLVEQGLVPQGFVQQELVPQGHVQPELVPQPVGVLIGQVPNGVMLQFLAQSPLVGAPLPPMGVAGPSPQPQADQETTQENWAAAQQCSYGSLCDCSDFEED